MRPLAVFTRARSTPCCSAIFRASGDAFTAPADALTATGGVGTAPVAAALAAGMTASAEATAPTSPAARMTAIVCPTGTTSPACAVTSRSTPDAGASISTVTLSVSISTIGSPFCTGSPGRLSQWTTLPDSWASSSAGMMMFVGIRTSAREDLAGDGERALDPDRVDVQVGDGTNPASAGRPHADTAGEQAFDGGRRRERARHLKEHDVGLDRRGIELHTGQAGQPLGEASGVGMVLGQALDVMPERVHAGGGDDARLAHGSAPLLLASPRLVDERARARQGGADRSAEAFREVDPRRVKEGCVVPRRDAARDDRVHEARAVHVGGEAMTTRHRRHRLEASQRPD